MDLHFSLMMGMGMEVIGFESVTDLMGTDTGVTSYGSELTSSTVTESLD